MTEPQDNLPAPKAPPPLDAATGELLLSRLEEILRRQLAAAKAEDYEQVSALAPAVDAMARRAIASAETLAGSCGERIRAISELHQHLELTLASQKHALAKQLGNVGSGKSMLRAYGQRQRPEDLAGGHAR